MFRNTCQYFTFLTISNTVVKIVEPEAQNLYLLRIFENNCTYFHWPIFYPVLHVKQSLCLLVDFKLYSYNY